MKLLQYSQLVFEVAIEFPKSAFAGNFDGDLENELRVLEELHYHSLSEPQYAAKKQQALIEHGMLDEKEVTGHLP